MDLARPLRAVRAAVSLGTLAAFLAGCTSWKPLETPYEKALSERHPDQAVVTLTDGSSRRLYRPVATADSLIGFEATSPLRDRVAIPVSRIHTVETLHSNGLLTGLVIGGVALVILGVLGAVALNDAFNSGS